MAEVQTKNRGVVSRNRFASGGMGDSIMSGVAFESRRDEFLGLDEDAQDEKIRALVKSGDRRELKTWALGVINGNNNGEELGRLGLFAPELLLGLLACQELFPHDLDDILRAVDLNTKAGVELAMFEDLPFDLTKNCDVATNLLVKTFIEGIKADPESKLDMDRPKANEEQLMGFVRALAQITLSNPDDYHVATWAFVALVNDEASDAALALAVEHAWMIYGTDYGSTYKGAADMLATRQKERGMDAQFLLPIVGKGRDFLTPTTVAAVWLALEELDNQSEHWEFSPEELANVIVVTQDDISAKARARLRENFPDFNLGAYLEERKSKR